MAGEEYIADRLSLFYDDFASGRDMGLSRPETAKDFKDGSYEPFITNEFDLQVTRGIGSFISMCDSAGICALENLKNYTFGNGFGYQITSKTKGSAPMDLLDECNEVIDEFLEENEWGLVEPELGGYAHAKGEFLHVLRNQGGGYCRSEIMEPAFLTEPMDKAWASEAIGFDWLQWSYGIATPFGESQVLGYCFDRSGNHSGDEIISPKDVVHFKLNVPRSVKRGLSDFYCCYVQMRQRAKVLDNTAEGTATQAAIAWIEEQAPGGVQASQVEATLGNRMDTNTLGRIQQQRYNQGTASTYRARRLNKGSVISVPNGKQYKAGPLGSSSGGKEAATMVADAVGRYIGSRWQMPEFMFNNNAATANYSSTFVAESPFVKATQRRQYIYFQQFAKVLWRVLEIAIQGRRITGARTIEELKQMTMIRHTPPIVETRDRLKETERNKICHDAGIMSPETWAEREDLDFNDEVERGAEPATLRTAELMRQQGIAPNQVPGQFGSPAVPGAEPGTPDKSAVPQAGSTPRAPVSESEYP